MEAAGAGLARLTCPSLVVWGDRDPYLPLEFGEALARRLPAAELEVVSGAAHWPWRDEPRVADRVLAFLEPS
jgi:pimeloyl-ACP methyl ester carboxylesterase